MITKLILDISANTTKNDDNYAKRMIDKIKKLDTGKFEIIFKAQLFETAGDNIPMEWCHFDYIYKHCHHSGYECTASVFDEKALWFLLNYDTPFIKVACNDKYYSLIGHIPRNKDVYVSVPWFSKDVGYGDNITKLLCVSKYPASVKDYESIALNFKHNPYLSDHTPDLELYKLLQPEIIEMHYALPNSTGLDADSGVCKTHHILKEIL